MPPEIFNLVKKKRLIDTYGSFAEKRLRLLIKGQVSTIGKPSLILNRLRGLNTGAGDDVIRNVFLEQLSSQCGAALAISELNDLQKLAQMADKITEAAESAQPQIFSNSTHNETPIASISSQLTQILERLEKLETAQRNTSNRNRPASRRNQSRSKSSEGDAAKKLCRLHRKCGKDARHCLPHCS